MAEDTVLLTITDAARQLGIATGTLRTHADSGRVPCIRTTAGDRLFRQAVIEAERERRHQAGRKKAGR